MRVLIRWDRFWGDTVWLGGNGTASGTPVIKGAGAIQGVNWGFRGRLPVVRNFQLESVTTARGVAARSPAAD